MRSSMSFITSASSRSSECVPSTSMRSDIFCALRWRAVSLIFSIGRMNSAFRLCPRSMKYVPRIASRPTSPPITHSASHSQYVSAVHT